MNCVKITHNAGFFSCCSVLLNQIVDYINNKKKLPDIVDSSETFKLYKNDINRDVTNDYFEHYENIKEDYIINQRIDYRHSYQFIKYANIDYKNLSPLIKKYFSPSIKINNIVDEIEKKYNIVHDNTIAVYYRGTDKFKETNIASFEEFYNQIIKIINCNNNNINILIQTDSTKFIDYIKEKNMKNIVIIAENKSSYDNKGIHYEQNNITNYQDMFYFLSTIIIMSKCKYIICSSGNCSIWTMLYRGNCENIVQYLNGNWHNNVV